MEKVVDWQLASRVASTAIAVCWGDGGLVGDLPLEFEWAADADEEGTRFAADQEFVDCAK